jgi:stalled ribosome rescue protein Dom34
MTKEVGLWIDHKQAVLVRMGAGTGQTTSIASGMEKHVRYSGHAVSDHGSAEDQRDRQYAAHLAKFYDEVIAQIGDAKAIFVFGPGEAKGELEKRLTGKGLAGRIVGIETTDKMTDHQVAAKVRAHYMTHSDR